ncbi:hypothetical protein [Perlabentimonas gracilis]|uniref:hypothetical protein n=1 Tax=Perlabentimonas gracilis TaxID=2715279 RepID=UPI001408C441|nr:hypothetical protein [Perlabentimonas gracilis]NHB68816.1 hypothetical protein [Perlabentimonas gracilis]
MKKWIIKSGLLVILAIFTAALNSCEGFTPNDEDEDEQADELYVKFCNEPSSVFTITSIEVRPRGPATGTYTPTDNWSSNILPAGTTIEPGDHVFFTLEIPSLHWSEYRLKVDDGDGNIINVDSEDLSITHWGDDKRTVGVTISLHEPTNKPYISGHYDFAGI